MLTRNLRWNKVALWTCGAMFLAWAFIVSAKYYTFQYTGWDLGLSSQLMWALCHGTTHTSLFGGSFLVDHANYIAFLLVPFYYFFQSALTLLLLKTGLFFTGAFILYLLAQRHVGPRWSLLLMLGYITHPANISMLFFEFNFENLALPLIILAFYQLDRKKLIPLTITCCLLCLIKENLPLVVMMFGLYATILRRKSHPSFLPLAPALFLCGLGIFLLQIFLIHPLLTRVLSSPFSHYWDLYRSFGNSPTEILLNLLLKPQETARLLFSGDRLLFLAELFGPLLIPALLSPLILLLALPLFLVNLLSRIAGQHSIFFYYGSTLAVFIFVAAVNSLGKLAPAQRRRVLALVIFSLLLFNLSFINDWEQRLPRTDTAAGGIHQRILSLIPKDAGVLTSYTFMPYLSQRKDLYLIGRNHIPFTHRPDIVPESVHYAIFDPASPRTKGPAFKEFLMDKPWPVRAVSGPVILFQNNLPPDQALLVTRPYSSVPGTDRISLKLGGLIELQQIDFPAKIELSSRTLPVTYYWKTLHDIPPGLRVRLSIVREGQTLFSNERYIGYDLPFAKQKFIEDHAFYSIPLLPSGNYDLNVQITQDIILILKNPHQESEIYTRKLYVR